MQQRFLGHCGGLLCSQGLGLPRPREENNSELAAWLLTCFLSSLSQSFHFHDVKKGTLILLYPIWISILIPKEHTYTIISKVQIHPGAPVFKGTRLLTRTKGKGKILPWSSVLDPIWHRRWQYQRASIFLLKNGGRDEQTYSSLRENVDVCGTSWALSYSWETQRWLLTSMIQVCQQWHMRPRWRQPWPPRPKHPCAAFRTLIRQLSWKLSNSVWGQKWTSAKGDQYKPECHVVERNLSWCDEHSWLSMMSSGIN